MDFHVFGQSRSKIDLYELDSNFRHGAKKFLENYTVSSGYTNISQMLKLVVVAFKTYSYHICDGDRDDDLYSNQLVRSSSTVVLIHNVTTR